MKKIILIGYMGCGKSTIGKLLAKSCTLTFEDLDFYIEKRLETSIETIFKTKGEIYFRKIENQYLAELLISNEKMVLSLGGGTPCFTNNNQLLFTDSYTTIYLKASVNELYNRLKKNKSKRPLLANLNSEEMKEYIGIHLFERSLFYNQATHIITVDGKSPDEIVTEIKDLIF